MQMRNFEMRLIWLMIFLLFSVGCSPRFASTVSGPVKLEPFEGVFYFNNPMIHQDDKFRGYSFLQTSQGKFLIPSIAVMDGKLNIPDDYYRNVCDMPSNTLYDLGNPIPVIKTFPEFASSEYSGLFSRTPEYSIPVYADLSLLGIDDRWSIDPQRQAELDIELKADFRMTLRYGDANGRECPLGTVDFSVVEHRKNDLPPLYFPLAGTRKSYPVPDAGKYEQAVAFALLDSAVGVIGRNRGMLEKAFHERREAIAREKIERHWALVVGVSEYRYPDSGLSGLAFADRDAVAVAELFHEKFNWPTGRIRLLTNRQAERGEVVKALENIISKMRERDLLTIYWSGHGFSRGEETYLACNDSRVEDTGSAISMPWLRRFLEDRKVRNVLFIADTCHAGGVVTGTRGLMVESYRNSLVPVKNTVGGWLYLLAAETDRQAVEDRNWGHGAFTYCLLRGLHGEADGYEGVGNRDGIITPAELRAYLSVRVPLETQQVLGTAVHPLLGTDSADSKIWEMNLYEE